MAMKAEMVSKKVEEKPRPILAGRDERGLPIWKFPKEGEKQEAPKPEPKQLEVKKVLKKVKKKAKKK